MFLQSYHWFSVIERQLGCALSPYFIHFNCSQQHTPSRPFKYSNTVAAVRNGKARKRFFPTRRKPLNKSNDDHTKSTNNNKQINGNNNDKRRQQLIQKKSQKKMAKKAPQTKNLLTQSSTPIVPAFPSRSVLPRALSLSHTHTQLTVHFVSAQFKFQWATICCNLNWTRL